MHGLTSTPDCVKKEDHLLCRRCCGKVSQTCPYCNIKVTATVHRRPRKQQQHEDDDYDGEDDGDAPPVQGPDKAQVMR